jgi:hypothetical protein
MIAAPDRCTPWWWEADRDDEGALELADDDAAWVADDSEPASTADAEGPLGWGDDIPVTEAPAAEPAPAIARVVLLPPARPTALRTVIAEAAVQDHRSLFCRRYDDCLDHAIVSGWVSWTCAACPVRPDFLR